MSNTTYILFGNEAIEIYNAEGINAVIEAYEENRITYAAFPFTEGDSYIGDLIATAQGWGDWAIITEEEYNLL